jgi:hypothetical protein
LNGSHWNYPEADDDYVASAVLIDSLLAQLTPMVLEDARTQTAALGRALITQARIAGLTPPVRPSGVDGIIRGLFAPLAVVQTQPFEENWDQLRDQALGMIGTQQSREILRDQLLDRVASFQGTTGTKAYAIDIVRLIDALGIGTAPVDAAPEGLPDDARSFMRSISDARMWRTLQPVIAKLRTFREQIADLIDGKLDKTEFVKDLREIIRLLVATATWPSRSPMKVPEFEQQLTEFQSSPIVDLVAKTATIVNEANPEQMPKLLNALGSADLGLIQRTMCFLTAANQLINFAEPRVAQEEAIRAQANPDAISVEILALFDAVLVTSEPVEEAAQ